MGHAAAQWVDEDREVLRTRKRVLEAKSAWEQDGRPVSRLLPAGRPLAEAEELLHKRPEQLDEDARDYIRQSRTRARRSTRLFQALAVAAILLAIASLVTALIAKNAQDNARVNAAIAEAREFAARSDSSADIGSALALAVEAELRTSVALPEARAAFARATKRAANAFALPDGAFETGREKVESIAWSPDGTLLAYTNYNTLQIRDARSGKLVGDDLKGFIHSVAWSRDGTQLASGGQDGIRLWDARTHKLIGGPMQHTTEVESVAWSPDGTRLASSSDDGTVGLWDARTGKQLGALGALQGHTGRVLGVAWSPDGTKLASSSDDGVRLWDGANGEPFGPNLFRSGDSEVGAVVWSPDGTRLAIPVLSGWDRGFTLGIKHEAIRLWKLTGRAPAYKTLQGHTAEVLSVAWSPDGSRLASGGLDGTIWLWDPGTGKPIPPSPQPPQRPQEVYYLAWSPDSRRLASASEDGIRVWKVAPGTMAGKPWWGTGGVKVVAWSPDGTRLAGGSDNGTVQVWDAVTGKPVGEPLLRAPSIVTSTSVTSIACAARSGLLVTGSNDGSLQVWDGDAGKPVGEQLPAHEGSVLSLAWSPDSTKLASAGRDGAVRLWDAAGRKPVGAPLRGHDGAVLSVAWSPDGTRLASGGSSGAVQLWDPVGGALIGDIPNAHRSGVTSLTWSPDGTMLATAGGSDGTIRVWSALVERDACHQAKQELGDAVESVLGDGRLLTGCKSPDSVRNLPPLPVLSGVFHPNR